MPDERKADAADAAADAQRQYWGRVLSATLRMARDLDIAEEATADAFALALQTWPDRGVPDSVEAWLLTAARRRAIDRIRRLSRFRERLALIAATGDLTAEPADAGLDAPPVLDDELRLVVLCCHPAIDVETQVALTMRLGCGVRTASVAAAFLVSEPTMAARLTRAKKRIAGSGAGIALPDDVAVEERMPAVRRTIQLAYAMGHTAGAGADLRDDDVAAHALRLARALFALRKDDTEAVGLLALIVLSEARAGGRLNPAGEQVLLADADRARWDRAMLTEGLALVGSLRPLLDGGRAGPLAWQAAIAAEHAVAPTFAATDWRRIVDCYDALLTIEPSPTIAIGRCVAVSYVAGAAVGVADIDEVIAVGGLERYPYAHAARAQMLDRLGRAADAGESWTAAARTSRTAAERDWFETQACRRGDGGAA
ncbi:MAG: DUF6596 domain-containing protein [Ilumatobacteraceae bacterium]